MPGTCEEGARHFLTPSIERPILINYLSIPLNVVMSVFPEITVIVNVSPDTKSEGSAAQLPAEYTGFLPLGVRSPRLKSTSTGAPVLSEA